MPVVVPIKDNYLVSSIPSDNNGASGLINIGWDGSIRDTAILEFQLPTLPECCRTVDWAKLVLTVHTPQPTDFPWRIARLIRPDWIELESSWLEYDVGKPWTIAGAEGEGSDIDLVTPYRVTGIMPAAQTGTYAFERLHRHVQDAIDNRAGIVRLHLWQFESRPGSLFNFFSREDVEFPRRPQLIVKLKDCEP